MKWWGWLLIALGLGGLLTLAVLVAPDAKRYLKIRRM